MEYRPLYPVMNSVAEIDKSNIPTFNGFVNAITIVFAFWVAVFLVIWIF